MATTTTAPPPPVDKTRLPSAAGAKDYFVACQMAAAAVIADDASNKRKTTVPDDDKRRPASMTEQASKEREHGAVTITLRSGKEDYDERAEVKVELRNPDVVVEKMLQTLATKFPPESLVTIASSTPAPPHNVPPPRDQSSATASSSSAATRSASRSLDGMSPIHPSLLETGRPSGRHYLGENGRYYREVADAKGRPIQRLVRDPVSGGMLPVGPQAYDRNGNPMPRMVIGPSGRPIMGLVVPTEGLDPRTGQPRPWYDGIDGTKPWEAVGKDGRPLLGFAVDPQDGIVKPVGPAVLGSDGCPIMGVIRGPAGDVISGIPLKPVPETGFMDTDNTLQTIPEEEPRGKTRAGYVSSVSSGPSRSGLRHASAGVTAAPRKGAHAVSMASSLGQYAPQASATAQIGRLKIPAPGYLLDDGRGVAPLAVDADGRPMDGYAQDPKTGRILPVGRKFSTRAPGLVLTGAGNQGPTEGLAVAPATWDTTTQQPIPHYRTTSDRLVPMPLGSSGHPVHGLARDTDGEVKPVGIPLYNPDGTTMDGRVLGPDGRPTPGIPIRPHPEASHTISLRCNNDVPASTHQQSLQRAASHRDQDDMMPVKYIEVPIVEEKIVHVPKREYVEVEKKVPRYEIETVERIVEVPQIEYVDRPVEVPKYEEVIREVKVVKTVDVPKELIKEVKRIETKLVEKHVEVPGPVVEVFKINYVEQKIAVPRYIDKEVPTVVAQKIEPIVHQTDETYDVACKVTEPRVITVDVFIPKPVQSHLRLIGTTNTCHEPVSVPVPQFNALTKRLNQNLEDKHLQPLLVREDTGAVPLLPAGERVETVEPVTTDWSTNYQPGQIRIRPGTNVTMPSVNIQGTVGLPEPPRNPFVPEEEDTESATTTETPPPRRSRTRNVKRPVDDDEGTAARRHAEQRERRTHHQRSREVSDTYRSKEGKKSEKHHRRGRHEQSVTTQERRQALERRH